MALRVGHSNPIGERCHEEVADAIAPLGLPMNPFDLLELVGLQVGAHVLDSMYGFSAERFYKTE